MRPSDSEREPASLLTEALRTLTRFASRSPRVTLWLVLIVTCAAIVLTIGNLGFKTKRSDLIDPAADFHQRWTNFTESFGDASDMIVVVEAEHPDTVKASLRDLGSRLEREPELFRNVLYRVDASAVQSKGLQFLAPDELESLLGRFQEFGPVVLQGRWDLLRLDQFADGLNYRLSRQLQTAQARHLDAVGTTPEAQELVEQTGYLTDSLARFLANSQDYQSPWPEIMPTSPLLKNVSRRETLLLSESGRMGFLKAMPADAADNFGGDSKSIARLRQLKEEVAKAHPGAKISLTGIPILESDEMHRSQSDMIWASLVSFAGVGLLMFLGFRGFKHPALALLMLAIGLAWSFGFTTLTVGHLNILSVSFAVILIGLGIDFAIHYLSRYLELRHKGRPLRPALLETSGGVGSGILTAAITTALAFFCATLTDFVGIAELGIIAGGGILLCALATFIVLPALVAIADHSVEPKRLPTQLEGAWLRNITAKFSWIVVGLSAALILLVGMQIVRFGEGGVDWRVGYDYNLLNLQADGMESVEVQQRVFAQEKDSLLYAVSLADSPEQARALRRKFEALPSVHHVKDLASLLPAAHPQQTQLMVQGLRSQLARLPAEPPPARALNPSAVGGALDRLYRSVKSIGSPQATAVANRLDAYLNNLQDLKLEQQSAMLNDFQYRMTTSLWKQFRQMQLASNPQPVTMQDLPAALTSRFVSPQGKWLVQVYPKDEIWEVAPLTRFVNDVRSVDPEVTGTPLQNYEASLQILRSYRTAAIYALAVIWVVLLVDFLDGRHKLLTLIPPAAIAVFTAIVIQTRGGNWNAQWIIAAYVAMATVIAAVLDFRNLRFAAFAMLPPAAGSLLMFGILGLCGIDLNPANLIVLPLILGIGVDDGVHVVHDCRMQKPGEYRISSSTINATLLTSLTSMVGFGSMMLAAHRGLFSVGLVLVIGLACCLFVSLVMLPSVLSLVNRAPAAPAQPAANSDSGRNANPKLKSVRAA